MGANRQFSKPQATGGSSGIRPTQSLNSTERSGFIDAERTLSRLNAKSPGKPPKPEGNSADNKVPRGKAVY